MSRVHAKRIALGTILLLGVVVLGYPRQVQIAPEWTIRVVDPLGKPIEGARVTQDWAHYDVARGSSVEHRRTDSAGIVVFPARTIRVARAIQVIGWIRVASVGSADLSTGPFVAAAVHYPDNPRGEVYPVSLPRSDSDHSTSLVQVVADRGTGASGGGPVLP